MADEISEAPTRELTKELSFLSWMGKIIERGTIVLGCVKDRQDIKLETDWEVIEMLHADWFFGRHIINETITIPVLDKQSFQPGLFDSPPANCTDDPTSFDDARDKLLDGIEVDSVCKKPKKKKKKK